MKKLFALTFIFLLLCTPSFAAQKIQEITTPKGFKVWLMQDNRLPIISLSFAFKGGVEYDPENKQGLAKLTAALLTQGAGTYDRSSFQEELAQNAISLNFSAGRDAFYGELYTLKKNAPLAFKLTALALTKPQMKEADLTLLRSQQETSIRFQLSDPSWQARYALFSKGYGKHPYAYRSNGTPKTLQNITRDDCLNFARDHFAQDNLVLAAAGDVSPKELGRLIDQTFGSLPKHKSFKEIGPAAWTPSPFSILVPYSGTQTTIAFARPSLKRDNPDWEAALTANYILGGGSFSSRLMKNVRIEKGLTYGIGTGLAPMDKSALLIGSLSSNNDKAARAISETKKTWQKFYEDGVTEKEVNHANRYRIGALLLSYTSLNQAADYMTALQLENLPSDYYNQRKTRILRLSKDDVNHAIKKWFDPEEVSYIYVGEPENVKGLEKQAPQTLGE